MDGKRSALLIGSSEFKNASLRRLHAPALDVEALANLLGRSDIGGFNVKTVVNQPRETVELAIQEFFHNKERDHLILLYFSGHGLKNDSNNLYFAMPDTDSRYLEATAVSSLFIHDMMQNCRARRQVILLDCCFSGAFPRGYNFRAGDAIGSGNFFDVEGSGQVILTASDDMQYAFEDDELRSENVTPSVFTRTVIEGITTGEADTDLDGNITLDDLREYVLRRLRAQGSRQRPKYWNFGVDGDILLAINPDANVKALAEDLRLRVKSPVVASRLGAIADLAALARERHDRAGLAAVNTLKALTKDDSRLVSVAAKAAVQDTIDEAKAEPSDAGENIRNQTQTVDVTRAVGEEGMAKRGNVESNVSERAIKESPGDLPAASWFRRIAFLARAYAFVPFVMAFFTCLLVLGQGPITFLGSGVRESFGQLYGDSNSLVSFFIFSLFLGPILVLICFWLRIIKLVLVFSWIGLVPYVILLGASQGHPGNGLMVAALCQAAGAIMITIAIVTRF